MSLIQYQNKPDNDTHKIANLLTIISDHFLSLFNVPMLISASKVNNFLRFLEFYCAIPVTRISKFNILYPRDQAKAI